MTEPTRPQSGASRHPAATTVSVASPVSLGGLHLETRLVSAPMAGVSDRTFRRLVREAGCGLAFPEMVSDKALLFGNGKTLDLAAPYPGESPFVIQLLGRDPDTLAAAARLAVDRFAPHLVDINMGCPVPKVTKNGEGAALLREPALCAAIIERVRRALPDHIPLSCKIRLGFDESRAIEVARGVAAAGAAFITVHGRLRTQPYSFPADWPAIAEVASAVAVPVVGNGDVLAPSDAGRLLGTTGCQAAMVGRGAMGNPWLFRRTLRLALTGDPGPAPAPVERVTMAFRHLHLAAEDKGERLAVLEMRRHGSWYIKGLPGASAVRATFMKTTNVAAFARALEDYRESLRARDQSNTGGVRRAGEEEGRECPSSDG